MKRKSLSQQWAGLSGFWKVVYVLFFLSMPWTILFVLAGIWHLDDRIDEVSQKVDSVPLQTVHGIDTIQSYRNYHF